MSRGKRTSGQSLLEVALTFPILLFLVLGLFDLGRAVFYYASLNTAAREGTRFAIVLPSASTDKDVQIEARIKDYLWTSDLRSKCALDGTTCKITVSYVYPPPPDPYSNDPYDPTVSVTITYQLDVITPVISMFIGNGGKIHLEVQSTMYLAPYAKPAL